jgi:hypothetical protein
MIPDTFWFELAALALSPLITASLFRAKDKAHQPQKTADDLATFQASVTDTLSALNKKVDTLSNSYAEGVINSKKSQRTMFLVQDKQFEAMTLQTGAIREVAHSVCNGNKENAMKLCDEADATIDAGRIAQKEYLLDR